ncbi:MAG: C25 family cysteine peptidase, partial [Planctomycetota bacterium]
MYWSVGGSYQDYDRPTYEIWVSRMWALETDGDDSQFGDERTLLLRALKANHEYRTGISRLPHAAYNYTISSTDQDDYLNALEVWPEAENAAPRLAFLRGAELMHEMSHGSSTSYASNSVTLWNIHDLVAQARFALVTSCSSGAFGGVVNNQLLTRDGGNVLSVGARVTCSGSAFTILNRSGQDKRFRALLAAGETWGDALLTEYAFGNQESAVFYGDLSIPVKASPANKMPVITSDVTASRTSGQAPLSVEFQATASDPDGSTLYYDWYVEG